MAIWLFIAATKIGITPDRMQWSSVGIPVLGIQVWVSMIIVLVISTIVYLYDDQSRNKWIDAALFLGIWVISAILLLSTPARNNFFAPGPYAPNFEPYPFSDAKLYDLSAQFALIGQGFRNGEYISKPLYTFFLYLLHLVTGNNFSSFLSLHVILLASLPAFVFAIGKFLHNRAAGLLAASFVLFATINAFVANYWIQVSHPKLLLTESLMAILLVFFSFIIMAWVKGTERNFVFPVLLGGLFGFTTLLRHNAWILLPLIVLMAVFRYRRHFKWLAGFLGAFCLALGLAISPWMVHSYNTVSTPWYFMIPLQGSVISNRYLPEFNEVPLFPAASSTPALIETGSQPYPEIIKLNQEEEIPEILAPAEIVEITRERRRTENRLNFENQTEENSTETPALERIISEPLTAFSEPVLHSEPVFPLKIEIAADSEPVKIISEPQPTERPTPSRRATEPPAETPESEDASEPAPLVIENTDLENLPPAIWREPYITTAWNDGDEKQLGRFAAVFDFITRHWFHNLAASAMTLPSSFGFEGSRHVMENKYPYWAPNWNGYMDFGSILSLGLSLAVVSIGIGNGWKKYGWSALVPLFVFGAYHLGTALARTSGGRYIVPVQWVVYLYFGMGIVYLFLWLLGMLKRTKPSPLPEMIDRKDISRKKLFVTPGIILLAVFLFGLSIPLSGTLAKPSIAKISSQDIDGSELPEDIRLFLSQEETLLISGRLLYPRFYPAGLGEPTNIPAYKKMDFSRLIFEMVGPDGEVVAILPIDDIPDAVPNGAEGLVIGCQYESYILTNYMILNGGEEQLILSSSMPLKDCSHNLTNH
jgi:hypothetical protein